MTQVEEQNEEAFDLEEYDNLLDKISSNRALTSRSLIGFLLEKGEAVKSADIQEALNMSPQSVTNVGARLEELGLITREKGNYEVNSGRIINLLLETVIDLRKKLEKLQEEK
ncbi:MAG: MarR family transcriptional regulator [Candidatus Heimdallarchaeota archaeon]|nr:MarR family transcriptional regulator [Candidatus Heimdallarchaeota archaeon]